MRNSFVVPIAVISVLVGFAVSAVADPIKRGLPACVSEELLDELTNYVVKGDRDGAAQLYLAGNCTTLKVGDSFDNEANIYFDYNFPVLTNKAVSTFKTTLDTPDFEFSNYLSVYPNPANEVLNIVKTKEIELQSIAVYDILGQLVIALPNIKDVSKLDRVL